MKALIDENKIVCQVEEVAFDTAPPTFWVDCVDNVVAYQYEYKNGAVVPLPPPSPPTAQENKQRAMALLQSTDWTIIPDVGDPAKSSPYLSNVQDFVTYRNSVRQYAINPVEGNISWPIKPQEIWV